MVAVERCARVSLRLPWRRERMPQVPDSAAFELAPDWIAEILSPSTEAVARADKLPIYAREKVQHIWLTDPRLQTLEAFSLDTTSYRLLGTWRGTPAYAFPPSTPWSSSSARCGSER
jgi:Uma2 family endonuclease